MPWPAIRHKSRKTRSVRRLAAASPVRLVSTKFGVLTVFTHRNFWSRSNGQSVRFPRIQERSSLRSMRNCLRRLKRRSTGPERAKWQHWCSRRPNVITLSCKNRPPCRPAVSGAAAAATNAKWQERTGSRRDAGVQFEPPEAARRRANGSAVFVSL